MSLLRKHWLTVPSASLYGVMALLGLHQWNAESAVIVPLALIGMAIIIWLGGNDG